MEPRYGRVPEYGWQLKWILGYGILRSVIDEHHDKLLLHSKELKGYLQVLIFLLRLVTCRRWYCTDASPPSCNAESMLRKEFFAEK
jgi:hypothetical protein